jgi:hypothetical protein
VAHIWKRLGTVGYDLAAAQDNMKGLTVQRTPLTLVVLLFAVSSLFPLSVRASTTSRPAITVLLVPDVSLPPDVLSDAVIARTAQALTDWMNVQVGPAWGLPTIRVLAIPRGAPVPTLVPWVWPLYLRASTDQFGSLGYHMVDGQGRPFGQVGVEDSLAQDHPWTVCLSHELAELVVDPYNNRIAMATWQNPTPGWLVEVADPVANLTYGWGDRGHWYKVTDWTYPAEFTPDARFPFDKLHRLTAPFSTTTGSPLEQFGVTQVQQ